MQPRQLELNFDEPRLEGLDAMVWSVIRTRCGKKNAVSVPELMLALGLDPNDRAAERTVRRAIERLVKEFGLPIGSSCDRTRPGYYHIVDADELNRHYRFLVRVAMAYLVRASKLKKSNLARLIGQLELELVGENGDGDI